jgi:hypothetical protein
MSGIREKIAWTLAGVLGLFVVASMVGVIEAGPLDPSGSPAPTMKTLDDIPGSWSRDLATTDGIPNGNDAGCNSSRFKCIFDNRAVLDLETGLVWERTVSSSSPFVWVGSQCTFFQIEGEQGWRLPTLAELNSLVEETADPPWLPPGHPFTNVHPTDPYWTSTKDEDATARTMSFDGSAGAASLAMGQARSWCVRGAQRGPSAEVTEVS